MKDILLIGFGGHSRSVIDTIEKQKQYNIIGFSDVNINDEVQYKGYKIICTDDDLEKVYSEGVKYAFVTIGFMGKHDVRKKIYNRLKQIGFLLPTIVDDTAILAEDVRIGEGTYIGKRTVINANTVVGKMCIINTGAIVEHDCMIGDFSHVAVSAVICGQCMVGKSVFVGANATVVHQRQLGNSAYVKAGGLVKNDILT